MTTSIGSPELAAQRSVRSLWEDYWQSDLSRRFTSGFTWSMISAATAQGGTFISGVIAARILGRTSFGELAIIQSTVGTIAVFGGLALALTTTKHVAEYRDTDPSRAGRIIALSTTVTVCSAALFSIALFVFSGRLAGVLHAAYLPVAFEISAIALFFSSLSATQTGILAGLEAFKETTIINFTRGLVGAASLVLGTIWAGLQGAVYATALTAFITWIVCQIVITAQLRRFGIRSSPRGMFREMETLWKFSLPACLSGITVGPILWFLSSMLARQSGGYAELGTFNAAERFRLMLMFAPTCMANASMPVMTSLEGCQLFSRSVRFARAQILGTAIIAAIPAVGLLLAAPLIMTVFGSGYELGATTLRLLALSAIPMALNTVFGQVLLARGFAWSRFGFDALLASLLVLSGCTLLPHFHANGLAAAYLVAYTTGTSALALKCRRLIR
jgi:O-antigen/teichoic acid export membrane protein